MVDTAHLSSLDSFPYRHRVAEVMSYPLLIGPESLTLGETSRLLSDARVSALVVVDDDGHPTGMLTERDLVNAIAHRGKAALDLWVRDVMSRPVHTVSASAFVHVAIGRMARLSIRHLVVVDEDRKAVGMITGRALLQLRSRETTLLADGVATSQTAFDLYRVKLALPELARHLLDEEVGVLTVSALIAATLREMTARAGELAFQSMADDGWGKPLAPWCLLILGSAGRGETLLGGDQDHALVWKGGQEHAPWFLEFGKRISRLLADSGIPLCKGKVMAGEPDWCRPLDDWKHEIDRWVNLPEHQTLLNVDIFFDFSAVLGAHELARELKSFAVATAAASPLFLQLLAQEVQRAEPPLGVLGGILTDEGRVSVKQFGLLPFVNAARVMALRNRLKETGTAERLRELMRLGHVSETDGLEMLEYYEVFMKLLLDQQLCDLAQNGPASSKIDPARLRRAVQNRLKSGFRHLTVVKAMVAHSLSS